MWKLEVKQGYDDMTFLFRKLDHVTGFIEAITESIVPDKDGNTARFIVTFEEEVKENTDESL